MGAFGRPKILEPLCEPLSQAAPPTLSPLPGPTPPKVRAPAWATQARALNLAGVGGQGGGCLAGFTDPCFLWSQTWVFLITLGDGEAMRPWSRWPWVRPGPSLL